MDILKAYKKYKIGIIGVGMVGSALARYFKSKKNIKLFLFDPSKNYYEDINQAEIIFICVPTPHSLNRSGFDLTALKEALNIIKGKKIVVIKSTVLPGTTREMSKLYPKLRIFFNPEWLTAKNADDDFRNPYLQIVGYVSKKDKPIAKKILSLLPKAKIKSCVAQAEIAEATKIIRNVLSVATVVIINEIYDILKKAGIEYENNKNFSIKDGLEVLSKIPSYHLKVIHKGGRGAGGHCLPKDYAAFINYSKIVKRPSRLLDLIEKINKNLLKKYPKKEI
jgi:nucleotide sugar dehydrogenase